MREMTSDDRGSATVPTLSPLCPERFEDVLRRAREAMATQDQQQDGAIVTRPRGRKPIGDRAMTSTERNGRRIARLKKAEAAIGRAVVLLQTIPDTPGVSGKIVDVIGVLVGATGPSTVAANLAAGLYDAQNRPVTGDMRPPDVTSLPMFAQKIIGTPEGIEVRYLGGNWYGDGPNVVLWNPTRQRYVMLPVSRLEEFDVAMAHLTGRSVGKKPRANSPPP